MAEGDSDPFAALDTHDGHGLVRAPPLAAEHMSRADSLALPRPEHDVNRQQEDERLLRERETAGNRRQSEGRQPIAVDMTGADYLRYAASCREFEQQHGTRQSDETDPQDAEVRRSARSTRGQAPKRPGYVPTTARMSTSKGNVKPKSSKKKSKSKSKPRKRATSAHTLTHDSSPTEVKRPTICGWPPLGPYPSGQLGTNFRDDYAPEHAYRVSPEKQSYTCKQFVERLCNDNDFNRAITQMAQDHSRTNCGEQSIPVLHPFAFRERVGCQPRTSSEREVKPLKLKSTRVPCRRPDESPPSSPDESDSDSSSSSDTSATSTSKRSSREQSRRRTGGNPNLMFNGDDYHVFRAYFMSTATCMHWDKQQRLRELLRALKGPARNVLAALDGVELTYDRLLAEMDDTYGGDTAYPDVMDELARMKRKTGQSVHDLAIEIRRILRKTKMGTTQRMLLARHYFIQALTDKHQRAYIHRKTTEADDLTVVKRFAVKYEVEKGLGAPTPSTSSVYNIDQSSTAAEEAEVNRYFQGNQRSFPRDDKIQKLQESQRLLTEKLDQIMSKLNIVAEKSTEPQQEQQQGDQQSYGNRGQNARGRYRGRQRGSWNQRAYYRGFHDAHVNAFAPPVPMAQAPVVHQFQPSPAGSSPTYPPQQQQTTYPQQQAAYPQAPQPPHA